MPKVFFNKLEEQQKEQYIQYPTTKNISLEIGYEEFRLDQFKENYGVQIFDLLFLSMYRSNMNISKKKTWGKPYAAAKFGRIPSSLKPTRSKPPTTGGSQQ